MVVLPVRYSTQLLRILPVHQEPRNQGLGKPFLAEVKILVHVYKYRTISKVTVPKGCRSEFISPFYNRRAGSPAVSQAELY
eukprot:COSAG02_NODE_36822_length_451_cov_0.629630_1_plen_81_part_10